MWCILFSVPKFQCHISTLFFFCVPCCDFFNIFCSWMCTFKLYAWLFFDSIILLMIALLSIVCWLYFGVFVVNNPQTFSKFTCDVIIPSSAYFILLTTICTKHDITNTSSANGALFSQLFDQRQFSSSSNSKSSAIFQNLQNVLLSLMRLCPQ